MGSLVFLLLLLTFACAALFLALLVVQRRLDRERKESFDRAFNRRPSRACSIINETHGKHRWWSKVRRPDLGMAWVEVSQHECPGVTYTLEHDIKVGLHASFQREVTKHIVFGEGWPIKEMTPGGPEGLITLEADPQDAFCGDNTPHEAHWPTVDRQQFYCDGNMDDDEERNW